MWKVQTGDLEPFWCMLLIFTRDNGQCFMPPIIVHQSKEYYQYIHFNSPLDWKFQHTPSVYMDRYRWLKSMTQFSNVCIASPINNQTLFLDGHDSYFDDRAQLHMECESIQPFVMKEGDSTNDQPNQNVPNAKLQYLYNEVKSACMLNFGTKKFLPHRMNSLLVESWDAFKVSAGNTIRYIFVKTNIPPQYLLS